MPDRKAEFEKYGHYPAGESQACLISLSHLSPHNRNSLDRF